MIPDNALRKAIDTVYQKYDTNRSNTLDRN